MSEFVFDGFETANTTAVPDILFDRLLTELSGAELKVLLYVIRRTRGFKKDTDAISLTQFEKGIITQEGKILDKGCGLNRETICKALKALEEKGIIKSQKRTHQKNDKDVSLYSIRFKGDPLAVVGFSDQGGSRKIRLDKVVGKNDYGSRILSTGVVGKSDPQETVLQETVKQQTEDTCVARKSPQASSGDMHRPPSLSLSDEKLPLTEEKAPVDEEKPAEHTHGEQQSTDHDGDTRSIATDPGQDASPFTGLASTAGIAPVASPSYSPEQEKPTDKPKKTRDKSLAEEKLLKPVKPTKAQIDHVFEVMTDTLRPLYARDLPGFISDTFKIVQSRKATDAVIQLIQATAHPALLKLTIEDMWNERDRYGECWWRGRGRMTVPAIVEQYASRAPGLACKLPRKGGDATPTRLTPTSTRPETVRVVATGPMPIVPPDLEDDDAVIPPPPQGQTKLVDFVERRLADAEARTLAAGGVL